MGGVEDLYPSGVTLMLIAVGRMGDNSEPASTHTSSPEYTQQRKHGKQGAWGRTDLGSLGWEGEA